MQPLASKFVAMTLAIAFAGTHVCVCLAAMPMPAASKDKHACCRNESKPKSEDPCKNCPSKQKIEQVAPERTGYAATLALDFHTSPAIVADDAVQAISLSGLAPHDTIPPPLILHDLVHSGCQLTV